MNLALTATILYLVMVLGIGFIASRRKGGAHEYFLAGRQLSWPLLLPLLAAEYISGGATVGIAEKLHMTGISGLAYYMASPLGLTMLAYGFAKFYQRIKKFTVGETVNLLFGHKTRIATVIILLLLYPLSLCTSGPALATIIGPLFGLSYMTAVWTSAAFIVVLALLGLRGQAWMNIIHFVTIIACFIPVTIAAVTSVGGPAKLFSSLPANHLNLAGDGLATMFAWITSAILIKIIALSAITAMFAARSERDAKVGAIGTGIFLILFVSMPAVIGLATYVVAPGIESKQALWVMSERLGGWATMLTSIAVLAAIISSTPASLLALSTLATRDIFLLFRPNASDRDQVRFSRLTIIFIGFVGTVLVLAMLEGSSILSLAFKSVGVRVIITIPILVSILWRRVQPAAAFLTILLGGIGGTIWIFSGSPYGVEPLWITLAIGFITLAIVSLIKKPSHLKGADGLV